MAEPILVVDAGAHAAAAAVVTGERAALVREPLTGSTVWPVEHGSSGTATLPGLLTAIRTAALAEYPDRVNRLTLTVPTGYPEGDRRRDELIEAGEAAGFPEVELLSEAHAALLDARSQMPFPPGALVLVCDLGDTWTSSLMQVRGEDIVALGHESSSAGRDLDEMLLGDLRTQGVWTEPRFGGPLDGRPAGGGMLEPGRAEAIAFLRRLKDDLGPEAAVSGRLTATGPLYSLTRERLDRLAEPGLRWIVASCRSLFARAAAGMVSPGQIPYALPRAGLPPGMASGVAPGATLADVSAVVLVGGAARLPTAEWIIGTGLDRPVLSPADPEMAVLRGMVGWAASAPSRRTYAEHPKWRVEPLTWTIPGGRGRLLRWQVGEGEPYAGGSVLAQVRTPDERVFDLTAADDGVLLSRRPTIGDAVGPTLRVRAKRPASALTGDPPGKRQELSAAGEWLLTPDRRLLVECGPGAAHVKLWSVPDGDLVKAFNPELDGSAPHRGRVFVRPGGRLSLVAWDPTGVFSIFDVLSGQRVVTFRDTGAPGDVTVNETEWRLTVQSEDSGSAGRYRRSVATVWDLTSGRRLEKLTDDRRPPGYLDRSAVDGFGAHAISPDGRMYAVALRTDSGSAAVALQEATSEHELFRAERGQSLRARTAFSADGQFLLANWESDRRSEVDVWEL